MGDQVAAVLTLIGQVADIASYVIAYKKFPSHDYDHIEESDVKDFKWTFNGDLWEHLGDLIGDFGDMLGAAIEEAWENTTEAIGEAWENTTEAVEDFVENVADEVEETFETAINVGVEIWTSTFNPPPETPQRLSRLLIRNVTKQFDHFPEAILEFKGGTKTGDGLENYYLRNLRYGTSNHDNGFSVRFKFRMPNRREEYRDMYDDIGSNRPLKEPYRAKILSRNKASVVITPNVNNYKCITTLPNKTI